MKLDKIIIQESPEQYESLALALQAVAKADGAQLHYDDICAALGTSFTAVSTTFDPVPGWWMTYGRDIFVVPAAKLFGIELRPLHHQRVGINMLAADEFHQHFEKSYKPLIRQALKNNQPVLTWQGWPEFRWPFWGVITKQSNDTLEGTTMWSNGINQQLIEPAMQCYVVEFCDPIEPPRDKLFATAIRHVDSCMNRAPFVPAILDPEVPAIVTGPTAFNAWEDWLESEHFGNPDQDQSWNEHRQNAEFIAAARMSAARFLNRQKDIAGHDQLEIIDQAVACCESIAERLTEARDEQKVRTLFATEQGRQTLLQAVHAAEADDRRLAMQVEQLL